MRERHVTAAGHAHLDKAAPKLRLRACDGIRVAVVRPGGCHVGAAAALVHILFNVITVASIQQDAAGVGLVGAVELITGRPSLGMHHEFLSGYVRHPAANHAPVPSSAAIPPVLVGDLRLVARCLVRAEEQNGVIVRGDVEVVKLGYCRYEVAADTPDKIAMRRPVVLGDPPLGNCHLVIGSGRHSIAYNVRYNIVTPAFILDEAGFMHRLGDVQGGPAAEGGAPARRARHIIRRA